MKRVSAFLATLCVFMMCGCPATTWESNTYKTLSASGAVITQAQVDFKNGTIPQTQCAADIINKAAATQNLAVQAFGVYATEKLNHVAILDDQIQTVDGLLANLAPIIADVTTLKAKPCAGPKSVPGQQPTLKSDYINPVDGSYDFVVPYRNPYAVIPSRKAITWMHPPSAPPSPRYRVSVTLS